MRLRALVRRAAGHAQPRLTCGPLSFDSQTGQFELDGLPLKLTAFEWRVLSALMLRKEAVIPRLELLERVYEGDADVDSNSLEVIVGRLRKKIGADLIETVRGMGYRLTAGERRETSAVDPWPDDRDFGGGDPGGAAARGWGLASALEGIVTRGLDQRLDSEIAVLAAAVDPQGRVDRDRIAARRGLLEPEPGWRWRIAGPDGVIGSGDFPRWPHRIRRAPHRSQAVPRLPRRRRAAWTSRTRPMVVPSRVCASMRGRLPSPRHAAPSRSAPPPPARWSPVRSVPPWSRCSRCWRGWACCWPRRA